MIWQLGLFFICEATLANIALASLVRVPLLPLKEILGKLRLQAFIAAKVSMMALQHAGSGHLPTPSASTGWHSVGVISSLSLQSGTPSPSVSLETPCASTGQPAGVLGSLSNISETPSPSLSVDNFTCCCFTVSICFCRLLFKRATGLSNTNCGLDCLPSAN